MKHISVLLAGLIFGFGLIISGMINPERVLGFLDIAGAWDPSLAFVMGGAVVVTFFGYRYVLGRKTPLFEESFQVPTNTLIDQKLVGGALLFGVGWGIVGLCPGPAIAGIVVDPTSIGIFVAAMLAGMFMARLWLKHT